jgi:amino acid transporter
MGSWYFHILYACLCINSCEFGGGFDSSVHISEEARNANVAIPWAIVLSTSISCILGGSAYFDFSLSYCPVDCQIVINGAITFGMGTDLVSIVSDPIGQPLATVRRFSFPTLSS